MGWIKILNGSLEEQGIIQDVYSSEIEEMINSDYEFEFTAPLVDSIGSYISGGNVVEVDDDYFDIAQYKKGQASNGKMVVNVECEHVSYRLNEETYNLDYFTKMGTPTEILTQLLSGTGFTVGTVDFTETLTYSALEAKSRRALLMEFVDLLGGEVYFNKFEVSILSRRGSAVAKDLLVDRNIEVLSKTYNKRNKDDDGNPLVSYECSLIRPMNIALGDSARIDYESLDIDVELRVVSVSYDPLNPDEVDFEIGNFVPGLEDDAYRIETSTVAKNKLYHGVRIGPENGFEAIRSDNYARGVFNSDTFALQTGDGTGNSWVNQVYFDPVSGKYIFNGTLSANVVEALGSVLTPYLYASKANIAELTVDQMNTGDKVAKYLNSNTDDVNYIKIDDQYMEWITASTDGASTVQVKDRDGNDLYWTDDTHTAVTTETTSYPVTIYTYVETTKMAINFELGDDGVTYEPMLVMGAGDGVTSKSGKSYIRKAEDGPVWEYFSRNDEKLRQIRLTDNGIGFTPKFFNICSVSNSGAVAVSAETTLDGLDIDFIDDTKIAYTVRMTVTPDAALNLIMKVRVNGIVVHTAPFDFSNGEDTIVMTGCIEGIAAGEGQTVDITITPSTSTANIAAGEYQLSLIISDIVAELEPAPVSATNAYAYGGYGSVKLQDCDEYNPVGDSWSNKTDMPIPARQNLATSTISNKGYIYGGYASGDLQDTDEYDAVGDSWSNKTDMPIPARQKLAASTILDKGYVYCGSSSGGRRQDTDEYDASGDSWSNKTNITNIDREQLAASTISDKGYTYAGWQYAVSLCNEYDPIGNSWSGKTNLPSPGRLTLAAVTISDKGYIFGGQNTSWSAISDCDEYDASGNSWSSKTNLPSPARYAAAASVVNNKGYVYGGLGSGFLQDCDEYDASGDSWANKTDMPSPARICVAGSAI